MNRCQQNVSKNSSYVLYNEENFSELLTIIIQPLLFKNRQMLICILRYSNPTLHTACYTTVQQAASICIKNLKLKNIQFVVNSFYQKKWKGIFYIFFCITGLRICMDFQIFASFLYPTLLKICSQKFDRKQFYLKYFKFFYYMYCKKINF